MRIGLYGMPTSGKTFILDKIDFMEVIVGSRLLREYDPLFDQRDEKGREKDRRDVAELMMSKKEFIMDGHYAFGDEIAFTEEEGEMYDVYLYLYIDPAILKKRMNNSIKNQKYLKYDIKKWQDLEIIELRKYCHSHNKDFYVIDHPTKNDNMDADTVIEFIKAIQNGYSCKSFARKCADLILQQSPEKDIYLLDGDKTLTTEDTSNKVAGYTTHLYDGNFYTGFQSWMQEKEFISYTWPELNQLPVNINKKILNMIGKQSFILTSGNGKVWKYISCVLNIPYFYGISMAAETKYFITKYLQEANKNIIAFGDGMNDYFMLKQANKGYLVAKSNGRISRSLKGKNLEGLDVI